jgi:hypothetical protein
VISGPIDMAIGDRTVLQPDLLVSRPLAEQPSLMAWELVDGEYAKAGTAVGDETWSTITPFAVELTPVSPTV